MFLTHETEREVIFKGEVTGDKSRKYFAFFWPRAISFLTFLFFYHSLIFLKLWKTREDQSHIFLFLISPSTCRTSRASKNPDYFPKTEDISRVRRNITSVTLLLLWGSLFFCYFDTWRIFWRIILKIFFQVFIKNLFTDHFDEFFKEFFDEFLMNWLIFMFNVNFKDSLWAHGHELKAFHSFYC